MYEFAWPWVFILLPLPLLVYFLFPTKPDSQTTALRTSLYTRLQSLSKQQSKNQKGNSLQLFIATLLWLLVIFSLARPQWIGDPIKLPASGRDLMLSVDISGSMNQTDLKLNGQTATRLSVVKHILSEFITRREGDRLGLILFGENAYLQTPLTFDLSTIRFMLMDSDIGLAGSSRTAIGDGIGLAVKRLKERPENNRILILLTDGQNNAGALEPIEAAKLASHAGIKIYTIGVGADEMLVKDWLLGQRKVNPSEELDEKSLSMIAQITGGRYFRARDEAELIEIYQELDKLEPIENENLTYRPTKEMYWYGLIAIVIIYSLLLLLNVIRHLNVIANEVKS